MFTNNYYYNRFDGVHNDNEEGVQINNNEKGLPFKQTAELISCFFGHGCCDTGIFTVNIYNSINRTMLLSHSIST